MKCKILNLSGTDCSWNWVKLIAWSLIYPKTYLFLVRHSDLVQISSCSHSSVVFTCCSVLRPARDWRLSQQVSGHWALCPAWETAGLCLAASAVCYSVNMKIAGRHGLYSGQGERERVSTMRRGGRVGADIALALGTGSWAVFMANMARSEASQLPK